MREEELRRLLAEDESSTVEFKVSLYLDKVPRSKSEERIQGLDTKRRGEFAKDVMALANASSCWGPWRYIIVGVSDDKTPVGIQPGVLDPQLIQNALTRYCDPPVDCDYIEMPLGDKVFGVIVIPDSPNKPHQFARDVSYQVSRRTHHSFKRGEVCVRHVREVRRATADDIVRLDEEADALRGSGHRIFHPAPVWRSMVGRRATLLALRRYRTT